MNEKVAKLLATGLDTYAQFVNLTLLHEASTVVMKKANQIRVSAGLPNHPIPKVPEWALSPKRRRKRKR